MPCESTRGPQSVYEKALLIVHEEKKFLTNLKKELEEHKIKKCIDYKLEERKLRKELIGLRKEHKRLENEAFKRDRDHKTVDDVAKQFRRNDRSVQIETEQLKKKLNTLPQISCTQRNIPRILRRDLSAESEYYTWTSGITKPGYRMALSSRLPAIEQSVSAVKRLQRKENKAGNSEPENRSKRRDVHSICYSIPISEQKSKRKVFYSAFDINE